MDNYSYIGWTPCVNGHLDFGLAKVGISGGFTNKGYTDVKVVDKNFSLDGSLDSHHRAIVLQSKVDWRDSEHEDARSGLFRVFLVGKVVKSSNMNERRLEGNILLYHLNAEPDDEEKIRGLKIHCLVHDLAEDDEPEKFEELLQYVSSVSNVTDLNSNCLVSSLKFSVNPNGLTYFGYNDPDIAIDEQSQFIVARQAFYYLKYSLHSHRHHVNEQDSLTTITPVDEDCGLRLLCQLKRELTSLSRTQKIEEKIHETSNALGIISYARSLVSGLQEDGLIDAVSADRERERLDNIALSFTSQEVKISINERVLEQHKSKAKVWLGFILISAWSIMSFYFSVDEKTLVSYDHFPFPLLPAVVLVSAVLAYRVIVRYYMFVSDFRNHEKLYNYASKSIWIKISSALAIVVLLFTVLLP